MFTLRIDIGYLVYACATNVYRYYIFDIHVGLFSECQCCLFDAGHVDIQIGLQSEYLPYTSILDIGYRITYTSSTHTCDVMLLL